jgi:hypothetical protein
MQREQKLYRGNDTEFISGKNWEKGFGDILLTDW